MFISTLDLFKIGVGPSSSHTVGPMLAAYDFINRLAQVRFSKHSQYHLQCILKGSLAFTGKGHATDKAVLLGLCSYLPKALVDVDIDFLFKQKSLISSIRVNATKIAFQFKNDIIFDVKDTLNEHPNGLVFNVLDEQQNRVETETYFSIGGGFIVTKNAYLALKNVTEDSSNHTFKYGFKNADEMVQMSLQNGLSIAQLKQQNECCNINLDVLNNGLDEVWQSMEKSIVNGLETTGILPGGLFVERRAAGIHRQILAKPSEHTVNDWLCAYAMAVNEENAAGHMVVTAPTNGAAGIIPAVIYYAIKHHHKTQQDIRNFLLTAAAIGGLIKHNSSISGAEVGCQGEVGSASAMAAAGLCAINGGTAAQIENAAEIALEHHLGMTCDPVKGLVQIPCIERNGFGAIKAFTASSLALHGTGSHLMSLDRCIRAMKRTGQAMSYKYKETSLGGLAVSNTEC